MGWHELALASPSQARNFVTPPPPAGTSNLNTELQSQSATHLEEQNVLVPLVLGLPQPKC